MKQLDIYGTHGINPLSQQRFISLRTCGIMRIKGVNQVSDMIGKALRLATALKGDTHAPNTQPLIEILPRLTHGQMMELRREYKLLVKTGPERKGVNIAKHIRVRLKGQDEDLATACYATALGRWESESHWANVWYHDDKTRRELLIEALMGRTNDEIRLIKEGFRDKKYGDSLTSCISTELAGDKFKKAVLMVLEEQRMEEKDQAGEWLPIDYDLVDDDARQLNRAVRSEEGGESLILEIIIRRSDIHLREVLRMYKETFSGANFARQALGKCGNLVVSLTNSFQAIFIKGKLIIKNNRERSWRTSSTALLTSQCVTLCFSTTR